MSNWQKVRLGDVCSFQNGFAFKSGEFDLKGDSYVVKIKELKDGEVKLFEDSSKINYSSNLGKYIINYDDVVVALTGDPINKNNPLSWVGRVAINKNSERLLLNQRVAKFCPDTNKLNTKFIYYYFRVFDNFYDLAQKATGSASQANISTKTIEDTVVFLPTLAEQERIAGILGALDDKIECNNRINRNLEEQAAALFRRWFVDFEFPDPDPTSPTYGKPYRSAGGKMQDSLLGSIPQGWQVGRLDDLISIKYGKDHKKLNSGTIPVYGSGGIMRYANASLYAKESVLIPRKGTLNNIFYINTPFWSVDTMFYSEMKIQGIAKFIYFFLKSKDLASMNAGSAVPSMTTEILNQLSLVIPDKSVFLSFDSLISPMFAAIQNNNTEKQTLATLRDSLLPKLMNNELSLDELPL